jgi:excinuclease ABC subunit A
MDQVIRIRGARQHNLKNLDLDIPRRTLTVVTGPSGSGKSSLALDTLFAEGQRRYVESLSTYAKQFLERMEKPDVDAVEGISPAVAIEQKNPTKSSRSTVGTATEVYDYLRLLWARVGISHCPECNREIRPDTVSGAVERVLDLQEGEPVMIAFPLVASDQVTHPLVVDNLRAMGFLRVLADGAVFDLGAPEANTPDGLGVDLGSAADVLVIVDRTKASSEGRERLADSLGTAFVEGDGEAVVLVGRGDGARLWFTERFRCPDHPDVELREPTPRLFSFNNPYGSCPTCTGFGATLDYDPDLIVPNESRSIAEGTVDPWEKPRYTKERDRLRAFARDRGVSVHTPWERLPESFRKEVLFGGEDFQGVVPFLLSRERKRYKRYIRVFLRQYQTPRTCPDCRGARVRREALFVRVGDRTIAEASNVPIDDLRDWLEALALPDMAAQVAESILRELRSRLAFLVDVGLGYLTLARQTRTLSGGEAQRINLANSLGSSLVDTLYVLDEPTIGLHPNDTRALLTLLTALRDAGNSVVVVEHDTLAIRMADHVVELGPASGERGGEIVFQGTPAELESADTATGRFISGRSELEGPQRGRFIGGRWLEVDGCRLHNVDGVDLELPVGSLTVVTGVSGSGKSTLVHDILFRALEQELSGGDMSAKQHLGEAVGHYDAIRGVQHIEDVVLVDQSPIGRTPRSNPVTYIKAWSEIRRIFSQQPLAMDRKFGPGHFSFNVKGGRCDACKGAGRVEVEMIFMADVYVACEVCGGRRFKPEILDVEYRGLNVSEVLDLTVDQAIRFFLKEDKLGQSLWHLQQVGLGYLRLGQAAPTLSGGEAQRLKIARELARAAVRSARKRGGGARSNKAVQSKLYILDEPTTGLSGEDVLRLLRVLDRLVESGHTVVVIEHNLDVIAAADWIVDMGPGAGRNGGRIVAMGQPAEIVEEPESVTAPHLARVLAEHGESAAP